MSHEGMVHALREAHRVLQPTGLLLDLRPGAVHRRIGIEVNGQVEQLAIMNENLDDDFAADHAVAEVIKQGWFKLISRIQVNCDRVMPLKDFEAWLGDFPIDRQASKDRLIQTVTRAYQSRKGKKKIVAKGLLVLKVLRKLEA